jgi:hypothetical protein
VAEVKRYKAVTTVPRSDPFAGGERRWVEGYYVKHITATPYPMGGDRDKFIAEHTKHYLVNDGLSDWGLPRELDIYEIDINTLEEI